MSVVSVCFMSFDLKLQPIACEVSFLQFQSSIDYLVLYVFFATFRWQETNQIEIGEWDRKTLQMQ